MKLEQTKQTFSQEKDCNDEGSLCQLLTVETDDGGAGPYLIISTERWALDRENISVLAAKLHEILDSFEFENEPENNMLELPLRDDR